METKSFEEALLELEKLVKELENKEISLDKAVENYQKGMEISKFCYDKLAAAEKIIVEKMEGEKPEKIDME